MVKSNSESNCDDRDKALRCIHLVPRISNDFQRVCHCNLVHKKTCAEGIEYIQWHLELLRWGKYPDSVSESDLTINWRLSLRPRSDTFLSWLECCARGRLLRLHERQAQLLRIIDQFRILPAARWRSSSPKVCRTGEHHSEEHENSRRIILGSSQSWSLRETQRSWVYNYRVVCYSLPVSRCHIIASHRRLHARVCNLASRSLSLSRLY